MESDRWVISSTECPVRMVTMPAVSSSPLFWDPVSCRQLSTILYRCLWGRSVHYCILSTHMQVFYSIRLLILSANKTETGGHVYLTKLLRPVALIYPFQNFFQTLSGSGCICSTNDTFTWNMLIFQYATNSILDCGPRNVNILIQIRKQIHFFNPF